LCSKKKAHQGKETTEKKAEPGGILEPQKTNTFTASEPTRHKSRGMGTLSGGWGKEGRKIEKEKKGSTEQKKKESGVII